MFPNVDKSVAKYQKGSMSPSPKTWRSYGKPWAVKVKNGYPRLERGRNPKSLPQVLDLDSAEYQIVICFHLAGHIYDMPKMKTLSSGSIRLAQLDNR